MRAQFDNQVLSSFLMFAEHQILASGAAHFCVTGNFYPTNNLYQNFSSYSCQFKPIVADHSIGDGCTKFTGLYLNNNFITIGVSGLTGINYKEGQAYFTNPITGNLSGVFSIAEVGCYLTDKSDSELLFETKYTKNRPINNININNQTGLNTDEYVYPAIYFKQDGSENEPFALGGAEYTKINIKAVMIMDSAFSLDAVSSIFRDSVRKPVALIDQSEFPFNYLGYHRSGYYHYDNLKQNKIEQDYFVFVDSVFVSKFSSNTQVLSELKRINPSVYAGLAEFEVCRVRYPRQ